MEKTKILSWPDFYRDRVRNREYDEYFRKKYARFLTEIILNIKRLSNLMSGEVVLKEEGCGIGSVVKNLSQFYPKLAKELTEEEINENAGDVTKIIFADLDSGILDLCRNNTRFMNLGRYLEKVPRFYTRENILERNSLNPVRWLSHMEYWNIFLIRISPAYYLPTKILVCPSRPIMYRHPDTGNHRSAMNVSCRLITGAPW